MLIFLALLVKKGGQGSFPLPLATALKCPSQIILRHNVDWMMG